MMPLPVDVLATTRWQQLSVTFILCLFCPLNYQDLCIHMFILLFVKYFVNNYITIYFLTIQ